MLLLHRVAHHPQGIGMVHVRVHVDGVTDLAVAVGAQRVRVALILPGAEIVPLFFIGVGGGILGMGATVASCAVNAAGVVVPVAVEGVVSCGPGVKGAVGFGRGKVYMAGEAIRLLHPWGAGLNPGKACRQPWLEVLHQPGRPGFARLFLG